MRTYGIARALAHNSALDLLYLPFGADQPDAAFKSIPGIELHEVRPSRGFVRVLAYMRARTLDRVPHDLARGVSHELQEAAKRLAYAPRRGRVIADGPTVAAALMPLAKSRPVIYNAHNLESAFRHELDGDGAALRRRLRKRGLHAFEARVLGRFAESWMVSDADIAGARALCTHANLRYVPNVIDVAAITPVGAAGGGARDPANRAQRAIFIGSFEYEPNRRALRFLIDEVMPLVWAGLPEARLSVVGAGLSEPPTSDPRVEMLGFVEDLNSAYAEAGCAVVPLLQGGGSPLKLIEALAHQLPVVATSKAVTGLQIKAGEHCLTADGPRAFADALLLVMRGEAPSPMALRGRRLVEERYSIEALASLICP